MAGKPNIRSTRFSDELAELRQFPNATGDFVQKYTHWEKQSIRKSKTG